MTQSFTDHNSRSLRTAMLAGALMLCGFSGALAGADDGGNKAFFAIPAPGSASGMPTTEQPETSNPVAAAQPNASISRTGVAQQAAQRPRVAATRMTREAVPTRSASRATVVRDTVAGQPRAVARRATPDLQRHALHRVGGSQRG